MSVMLPDAYKTDAEWNALSKDEQAASWTLWIEALKAARSRVNAAAPGAREVLNSIDATIRDASKMRDGWVLNNPQAKLNDPNFKLNG